MLQTQAHTHTHIHTYKLTHHVFVQLGHDGQKYVGAAAADADAEAQHFRQSPS